VQQTEQYYSSAGSEPVPGAARSPLEEVATEELMALPPSPVRPRWMRTRFPVDPEEFQRLQEEAQQPGPTGAEAEAAAVDPTTEDEDVEAAEALAVLDPPEGQAVVAPGAAAPTLTRSFEGIGQTAWRPPDPTMAVGPNHVLVAVNTDLAGYSKGGTLLFRWANMTTLFGPVLPSGASLFDPRLAYDHYAQRWIVVVDARRPTPAGSWIMVAVSQGPDPAGAYWVWALDATLDGSSPTSNWADYSMLGFDTQAIYISSNMFAFNGGFQYAKLRILRKAELYAGGVGPNHAIRWHDFWNLRNPDNSMAFTVQPAAHFRGLGGNPPAYLVNAIWPSSNTLTLWTLSNPIALWVGGTASLSRVAVACRSYELPPQARQPGTNVRLATNDTRLLNAVYQNAGGGQRLWTCQTSAHTWSGDSEARCVVQWYEIDVPSQAVVQQNRYGAIGRYYFFPDIQTDLARNAYVVFSRSSDSEFGQLRQTGRRVGDAANDLQGSVLVKAGEGIYTGGRWGDYFGIGRDGGDSSTVWMYGQYADTGDAWATRVCAARFG
jgi:hypothetical protein